MTKSTNKGWQGTERRTGPDIWIYILRLAALLGWIIFIAAMIVSHYASPEPSYGIVRYHNLIEVRSWARPLTGYLYLMLWVAAAISYLAIIINHYRSRRSDDFAFFNLFLLLFSSLAWVVYLILKLFN